MSSMWQILCKRRVHGLNLGLNCIRIAVNYRHFEGDLPTDPNLTMRQMIHES